ncbi:MAG: anaerobic ribonucleoside-triphosphate reductase activating protein [Oscillospiraceae bacterium]|nr:anaerobic ribonucleoside-triphosphate reductase activating protein [Oscillospiraceae bacterium]
MNYAELKINDIANGYGVRVSLFVSGCTHRCPGCFNEIAWDFDYGAPFDEAVQERILRALAPGYVNGLTLLGGEPFEPVNQRALVEFVRQVKQTLPEKNIWCYTGYVLEKDLLAEGGRARCEVTDALLEGIDVLVDGPFVQAQYDISLLFRGSANQRLIDMNATRKNGAVTLWQPPAV